MTPAPSAAAAAAGVLAMLMFSNHSVDNPRVISGS